MIYEKVNVEKVENVQVTIRRLRGVQKLRMGETEFTKVGLYKHIWQFLEWFLYYLEKWFR